MKKLVFIIVVFTSGVKLQSPEVFAQQNTLYSQYMFNIFTLNPGYAGSRQSASGVLVHRNQWVGMNGSPKVGSFSFHTPVSGKKVALGFNMFRDHIGPSNKVGVFATYAYHLPLPAGKLSMSLRGGVYRYRLFSDRLDFKEKADPAGMVDNIFMIPSFDFGLYYYTKTLFAGLSVLHLTNDQSGYKSDDFLYTGITRQFIGVAGRAFVISTDLVLKPSVNLRIADGQPVNADMNISALFKKTYWIGFSYRSSKDLVLVAECNLTPFFRAGYSYDVGLGGLKKFNSGSHEIFVGFDLKPFHDKVVVSPRYL